MHQDEEEEEEEEALPKVAGIETEESSFPIDRCS